MDLPHGPRPEVFHRFGRSLRQAAVTMLCGWPRCRFTPPTVLAGRSAHESHLLQGWPAGGDFGVGTWGGRWEDATWSFITSDGSATVGKLDHPYTFVETDLQPFEEDVIVQLDTLDGVMRMWAWRDEEQPDEDIAPLIEEEFDLPAGSPWLWVRGGEFTGALFRWVAISTDHMPVNMPVPLSDLIGDFSGNDILDITDIDLLAEAIQSGKVELGYDLNQDGVVDLEDHAYWVTDVKHTWIGDANLDGEFNSGDFVDVFQTGKYETGETARWNQGDWNVDGAFDSADFVTAFQGGGYEIGTRTAVAAVPEPSSVILLALALVCVGRIRKR